MHVLAFEQAGDAGLARPPARRRSARGARSTCRPARAARPLSGPLRRAVSGDGAAWSTAPRLWAYDRPSTGGRTGVSRARRIGASAAARQNAQGAIDTGDATSQVKHLNLPAQGTRTVAKPELGTKRLCAGCGAKYYDLNKDPIVCPKCRTVHGAGGGQRARAGRSRSPRSRARGAGRRRKRWWRRRRQEAEFVSLEEADAEAQGKKPARAR